MILSSSFAYAFHENAFIYLPDVYYFVLTLWSVYIINSMENNLQKDFNVEL